MDKSYLMTNLNVRLCAVWFVLNITRFAAMSTYNQHVIELPQEPTYEIRIQKIEKRSSLFISPINYQVIWSENILQRIHYSTEEFIPKTSALILLQPGQKIQLDYSGTYPTCWEIDLSPLTFLHLCTEIYRDSNPDVLFRSESPKYVLVNPAIGVKISSIIELAAEISQTKLAEGEAAVYALVKTLFIYCIGNQTTNKKDQVYSRYTEIVRRFRHDVALNHAEHHHVTWYANQLNVSSRYLNRMVKVTLGKTAKSLILKQLFISACHDLENSNLSVKEIAVKLGFSEPEHFSNFFKKTAGCSPKSFRENLNNDKCNQERKSYSPVLSLTN